VPTGRHFCSCRGIWCAAKPLRRLCRKWVMNSLDTFSWAATAVPLKGDATAAAGVGPRRARGGHSDCPICERVYTTLSDGFGVFAAGWTGNWSYHLTRAVDEQLGRRAQRSILDRDNASADMLAVLPRMGAQKRPTAVMKRADGHRPGCTASRPSGRLWPKAGQLVGMRVAGRGRSSFSFSFFLFLFSESRLRNFCNRRK
jgi:hypothetical protein